MAVDMFLKITGVEGECQKKGHEKEIDIDSFSVGAVQHGTFHTGGQGGGGGKAEIRDLSITKTVDKASPKLFSHCCTGKHLTEVLIVAQRAGDGEKPMTYYTVKLEDVIVSNVDMHGAAGGDAIKESVVFNTAKLTFDYQAQDKTGAKEGGVVTASYNIRENVAA